jgi:5-methylcytosine-specific restriction endonuclease McrA
MTIESFATAITTIIGLGDEKLKRLEEEKTEVRHLVRDAIEKTTRAEWPQMKDEPQAGERISAYLYWNVLEFSVTRIAELFNCTTMTIQNIAKQHQLHGIVCHQCGEVIYINSRADLHSREGLCICDRCKAERDAITDVEREHQRIDREARRLVLHTMPYAEYLRTDEWQATRTRKLRRAHFTCELCSREGTLHVHHKTYERRGYEEDRDLIVLCAGCHAKFHDKLPKE